jgi:hypothetical protein
MGLHQRSAACEKFRVLMPLLLILGRILMTLGEPSLKVLAPKSWLLRKNQLGNGRLPREPHLRDHLPGASVLLQAPIQAEAGSQSLAINPIVWMLLVP